MAHFHGIGQAREHVGVERAESDAAGADISKEFVTPDRGGLFQIALQGPDGFHIPFVAGIGRIVPGVADEAHGLLQVVPLFAFDVTLQVGVSNVVVRVGEKIDISLVDWRDGNRDDFDDVAIEIEHHGDGGGGSDCRDGQTQDVRADVEIGADRFVIGDVNFYGAAEDQVIEAEP